MTRYVIRVDQDGEDTSLDYSIQTRHGEQTARLLAFLMDGGAGREYNGDRGMTALALTYTSVVATYQG